MKKNTILDVTIGTNEIGHVLSRHKAGKFTVRTNYVSLQHFFPQKALMQGKIKEMDTGYYI